MSSSSSSSGLSVKPKTVIRLPRTSKRKSKEPHKSPAQDMSSIGPMPFPAAFRLITLHALLSPAATDYETHRASLSRTKPTIAATPGFETIKASKKSKAAAVKRPAQLNPREPTSTSMRVSRSQSRRTSTSPPPSIDVEPPTPIQSPSPKKRKLAAPLSMEATRKSARSSSLGPASPLMHSFGVEDLSAGHELQGRRSRLASPLSFGDGSVSGDEDGRRASGRLREEPGHLKDYSA